MHFFWFSTFPDCFSQVNDSYFLTTTLLLFRFYSDGLHSRGLVSVLKLKRAHSHPDEPNICLLTMLYCFLIVGCQACGFSAID
jgi:hypothetical protein